MSKIYDIYDCLTLGVLECVNSNKYKSPNTRRFDICNRYNSAISYVIANASWMDAVDRATVKGLKGLITKSICDSLTDEELKKYITKTVCPILKNLFEYDEF